jgi:predicted porin
MKKSLIALAVAGVVASPAFADTANVNIYGRMAYSLDWVDTNSDNDNDDDLVTGRDNVSRVGVKGTEDLGNGLSAVWQAELQLNTTGDGSPFTADNGSMAWRNTFAGLSGKTWGTLIAGRHDTPYKLATGKLDIFSDTAGDYNGTVGNVIGMNVADLRADGTIAYITPNWSGFHAAIAYVDGAGLGTDTEAEAWSVMGMYENGPLFLSAAYEDMDTDSFNLNTPLGVAVDPELQSWKIGAGFKFGNFQIGGLYENIELDADNADDIGRQDFYVNGQYTMGAIVLKAAWGYADEVEDIDDSDAMVWTVGADYNLSKRTKLFALYTMVDNEDNARYRTSTTGYARAEGEEQEVFSLGIVHNF